jgi:hypothetical protein
MRIFAKKVEADGYKFDSEMEYAFYLVLKARLNDNTIRNLEIHPSFELQPAFVKNGKSWKSMNYEADFMFYDCLAQAERIVDVKGMVLPEFEIHRKLFEYKYSYYNLEVLKYSKTTGWVSIDDYKKTMRSKRQQIKAERSEFKKRLERIAWLESKIKEMKKNVNVSDSQKTRIEKYEQEFSELINKK